MKRSLITAAFLLLLPTSTFSQSLEKLEEVAPFSEGLAAVRKGIQWGFINKEGDLAIDFRDDVYWNKNADTSKPDVSGVRYPMFHEGRCLISKTIDRGSDGSTL